MIGTAREPVPAKRVSLTYLLTGLEDSQWVEIEGVVQSVNESGMEVTLEVAMDDGIVSAITVKQPGIDYSRLVDSKVQIKGNAAALFNRDRQMTGFRIMFRTWRH